MIDALVAAVLLGALSTLGDFVWAALRLHNRVGYGMIHGAAICMTIGGLVGARVKQPLIGALIGPMIGVVAAGGFYALAPAMGWSAMFLMWMLLWICFGLLEAVLGGGKSASVAILQGVIAALLSGAAFYAISGIWTNPSPAGPNYLRNFASWTFAFFPGFAALFWTRR